MVQKYQSLNVNRRAYRCQTCGWKFFSVEIAENLFDELRQGSRILGLDDGLNPDVRKTNA